MDERLARSYLLSMLSEMQSVGSWCGETHLQKCTYLLGELEGTNDLPFEFIMYKHGPYSFDLHDMVSELESSFLIEREATPPYGSHLRITPLGEKYLHLSDSARLIDRGAISAIATTFATFSVAELERFSTAAYVMSEIPEADIDAHWQRMIELKPHLNKDQAKESINWILRYLEGKRPGLGRD